MTPEDKRNYERYFRAAHAVQSAVAFEIARTNEQAAAADSKHLRTGLNMCLVDASAVAQLLIKKGVITESEYFAALATAAEEEQARLTEHVRKLTGAPISFG